MAPAFFDGWAPLLRTLLVGTLAYGGLVLFLRLSGNRTLSKMNAFDLIVTVALGSTLATILLSNEVVLAQGLAALALLIVLQYLVTWSSVRVPWVRRVTTGEPRLLLSDGHYLDGALRRARVTRAEVRAAVRASGRADLNDVAAVIMETDGSFSVVGRSDRVVDPSMEGVQGR